MTLLLALFRGAFGTRHADATEHQDGLVLADRDGIHRQAAAFLTVGLYVIFFLFDGPADWWRQCAPTTAVTAMNYKTRWHLAAAHRALRLRHHHAATPVLRHVVENRNGEELRTASCSLPPLSDGDQLFVLPIAFAGLAFAGPATRQHLYVLSLRCSAAMTC